MSRKIYAQKNAARRLKAAQAQAQTLFSLNLPDPVILPFL